MCHWDPGLRHHSTFSAPHLKHTTLEAKLWAWHLAQFQSPCRNGFELQLGGGGMKPGTYATRGDRGLKCTCGGAA